MRSVVLPPGTGREVHVLLPYYREEEQRLLAAALDPLIAVRIYTWTGDVTIYNKSSGRHSIEERASANAHFSDAGRVYLPETIQAIWLRLGHERRLRDALIAEVERLGGDPFAVIDRAYSSDEQIQPREAEVFARSFKPEPEPEPETSP